MMNINEFRDLYEYCDLAAHELLDNALFALIADNHTTYDNADFSAIDTARAISADELESSAFTDTRAFAPDSDAAMIITYETICAIIRNITNCAYDDICAEY